MATQDEVRRIATSLPEASEDPGFAFLVGGKLFAWVWMQRVAPKRPRVPNPDVIAVRVSCELEKQSLLAMDPDVFFTEPHYDGYPAVLVRLPAIDREMLEKVVTDAWRNPCADASAPQGLLIFTDLRHANGGSVTPVGRHRTRRPRAPTSVDPVRLALLESPRVTLRYWESQGASRCSRVRDEALHSRTVMRPPRRLLDLERGGLGRPVRE